MIEPVFLAHLRQHHRAEMVLVMVQLEQVCPGWWEQLSDLAEQLGTDRATLNRSLRHLEDLGLIRRYSISNRSGTWIWWVKRHAVDGPRAKDEPAWRLRCRDTKTTIILPVSRRREWAKRKRIPMGTLCGFLYGRQELLRGRWRLVGSPWDVKVCDSAWSTVDAAPDDGITGGDAHHPIAHVQPRLLPHAAGGGGADA